MTRLPSTGDEQRQTPTCPPQIPQLGLRSQRGPLVAVATFSLLALMVCAGTNAYGTPRPAPSWRELSNLLNAWRVPDAELMLDDLTQRDGQSPTSQFFNARLLYLKGEYQKSLDMLDTLDSGSVRLPVEELRKTVASAMEEVRGFSEIGSQDGLVLVRVRPGPDEVMVPIILEEMPKIRDKVGEILGYWPEDRIVVDVYPEVEALSRVTSLTVEELEASGTIAICRDNRLMITTPRKTLFGYPWLDTLAHEYIHLIVTRVSLDQTPIWLHEGFARFIEVKVQREGSPRLDAYSESLLAAALENEKFIGFERMSPSMAKLPTQEATTLAFAEVFSAIQFIHQRKDNAGLRQILLHLANGASDREAVSKVTGLTWTQFGRQWLNSLQKANLQQHTRQRIKNIRFRVDGIPEEHQELEQVSGKERDLTQLGRHLEGRGRFLAASKIYEKAEREAGEANPYLRNRLAWVYLRQNRADDALEALKKVDELFPSFGVTYKHMGMAHMAKAQLVEARRALERAISINPFDPAIHELLAKIYGQAGEKNLQKRAMDALNLISEGRNQR